MSHHNHKESSTSNGALVVSPPGNRQQRNMAESNDIHPRNVAPEASNGWDVTRNTHREPIGHECGSTNNVRTRFTSLSNAQSENIENPSCEEGAVNKECATKSERPECPVCLQSCTQPVKLPCSHVFCFLCLKGIALQNGRCALCRTGIPRDFLNDPDVLLLDEETSAKAAADDHAKSQYQWFYEGTAGWWQYEERNAVELEEKYQLGVKVFEMVIVGLVFVVDLNQMVQYRRNDPNKRRRIKRDAAGVSKKGVAGIKVRRCAERSSGDGGESSFASQPAPPPLARSAPLLQPIPNSMLRGAVHRSSPAVIASGSQQLHSTVGRRLRSLRRNGSDSDSASDDTDVQALDGLARRGGQRPAPIGDESNGSSSNSQSARTLVGAPTMYVHSAAAALSNDQRGDGSSGDSSVPVLSHASTAPPAAGSRPLPAVVPHDVRIVDGQDSPLYYSGMTTPSNTPRSVASGTGSPTERHVPTHSVHFEALIDGITGLVSGDGSGEERLTPTSGAQ